MVILLVRCRVAEKVQRTDTVGDRWFMSVTTNWTFRHHKRLHLNRSGIDDVLFSKSSDTPRLVRQEMRTSETPSDRRPILYGYTWKTFLGSLCVWSDGGLPWRSAFAVLVSWLFDDRDGAGRAHCAA